MRVTAFDISKAAEIYANDIYGKIRGTDAAMPGKEFRDGGMKEIHASTYKALKGKVRAADVEAAINALSEKEKTALVTNINKLKSGVDERTGLADVPGTSASGPITNTTNAFNPASTSNTDGSNVSQKPIQHNWIDRQAKMNKALETLKAWYHKEYNDDLKILRKDVDTGIGVEDKGNNWDKLGGVHGSRLSNKNGYNTKATDMLEKLGFVLVQSGKNPEELALNWKEPTPSTVEKVNNNQNHQRQFEEDLRLINVLYKQKFGYDMNFLREDYRKGVIVEDRGIPLIGTQDGRNRSNLLTGFHTQLKDNGFTLVDGDPNSRELKLRWRPH